MFPRPHNSFLNACLKQLFIFSLFFFVLQIFTWIQDWKPCIWSGWGWSWSSPTIERSWKDTDIKERNKINTNLKTIPTRYLSWKVDAMKVDLNRISFMHPWQRGAITAMTKKGSQQMMKAPVTIANVFAAFFSLFASNEMCFFSFFSFRGLQDRLSVFCFFYDVAENEGLMWCV